MALAGSTGRWGCGGGPGSPDNRCEDFSDQGVIWEPLSGTASHCGDFIGLFPVIFH